LSNPARPWRIALSVGGLVFAAVLVLARKPWTVDLTGKHDVLNYWAVGSWWAAALGLAVCAGLAVLSPWWAGRPVHARPHDPRKPSKWGAVLVVSAMVFAAVHALPRMGQSFWDDEELNVRKSVLGKYEMREDDSPRKFRALSWADTALEYREPNNHALNTVLARACHDLWRALAGPVGLPFTEWPMRVPALVAGVLAVAAAAWALWVFGMPQAGVYAAWLAALHPWYLRYSSELRGYAFALLLVPVVFALWHRAVFRGGWVWWGLLCAAQAALVLGYPGTLFVVVVLNLCTPPVLIFQRGAAGPAWGQSGRWFVCNSLSAVAVAFWLFPLLPQVKAYIASQSAQGFVMGWPWFRSVSGYFLLGAPWWKGSTPEVPYPEIVDRMGQHIWVFWVFLGLVAAGFFAGLARFAKLGPAGVAVLLATLIPPWMTYGYSVWSTQIIYESYIIFALPGLLLIVAAGHDALTSLMAPRAGAGRPSEKSTAWAASIPLVAFAVFFFWLGAPIRSWLVNHPLQAIRESVLLTRPTLDPTDPRQTAILTASFCIPPYLYDPWMVRLDSPREMLEIMRRADAGNKPLYLNIGMPWAAREYSPGMWALADDPSLFTKVGTLRGWDAGLDRIIFLYQPGSSAGRDFGNIPNMLR